MASEKGMTFTLTWQKALGILAFFGITSYGGLMLTLRAGALWLVGPSINAHADTLAVRERAWADSAMKARDRAVMDSVMVRMDKMLDMLMDVREIREQQEKKARERKQKVRRRVEWIETLSE